MTQLIGLNPTVSGTVQTVGAVTNTICTFDAGNVGGFTASSCTFFVHGLIVGATAGGANGAGIQATAAFRRAGGSMIQIGSTTTLASFIDGALVGANIVIDTPAGTQIRLRAVGVLAQTISWNGVLAITSSPF